VIQWDEFQSRADLACRARGTPSQRARRAAAAVTTTTATADSENIRDMCPRSGDGLPDVLVTKDKHVVVITTPSSP
jgi:hypothetical protein